MRIIDDDHWGDKERERGETRDKVAVIGWFWTDHLILLGLDEQSDNIISSKNFRRVFEAPVGFFHTRENFFFYRWMIWIVVVEVMMVVKEEEEGKFHGRFGLL